MPRVIIISRSSAKICFTFSFEASVDTAFQNGGERKLRANQPYWKVSNSKVASRKYEACNLDSCTPPDLIIPCLSEFSNIFRSGKEEIKFVRGKKKTKLKFEMCFLHFSRYLTMKRNRKDSVMYEERRRRRRMKRAFIRRLRKLGRFCFTIKNERGRTMRSEERVL